MSQEDFGRQRWIRSSKWFPAGRGTLEEQLSFAQWLSWLRPDGDMTWVDLSRSDRKTDWLVQLRRFPSLTYVQLHDRQLGPGLNELRDHRKLTYMGITAACVDHLAELRRLPELEVLELHSPSSRNLDFRVLESQPKLTELMVFDCEGAAEIVRQMDVLKKLENVSFDRVSGISDDAWSSFSELNELRFLSLMNCSPISDLGLNHLSKLERLETLVLTGSIGRVTTKGFHSLGKLTALKQLVVSGSQVSQDQLMLLKQLLPDCTISVR